MRDDKLDAMTEVALAALSDPDTGPARALVRDLALGWPQAPALAICFALTTAASRVEDEFVSKTASRGFRLAAMVAADCFALEAMGRTPATCEDLLLFWRRVDPYFLEL
ncbi:hypothetical protein AQS8620_03268 [Aquimixticola soesokkakensis]|uniref:Uncharacterized protein n=1 Tax=Aquimixticola soesokkakensis TaxID=1519096 RepID=A0A1Y5TPC3_9RHOB|nr:hypothetical protein [Aquimixticola soesokkakensis]SLN68930.1 hypothetical protein AQS8620_03268 [Aquimixticola soesokkakensis]